MVQQAQMCVYSHLCLEQLSMLLLAPLHPQAARLLCSFREYHRRAQLGLATFYANKLAALEDGLLNARETLFAAQEQQPEEQEKLVSQEQVRLRAVYILFALRVAGLMIWWRGGQLYTAGASTYGHNIETCGA
jgi:hypothetical protein